MRLGVVVFFALFALTPLAEAAPAPCEPEFCITDETAHEGGSCETGDGNSAETTRYLNASGALLQQSADASLSFYCKQNEPAPGFSQKADLVTIDVLTQVNGRQDRLQVLAGYGDQLHACRAGLTADPARVSILDEYWSFGVQQSCPAGIVFDRVPSLPPLLP